MSETEKPMTTIDLATLERLSATLCGAVDTTKSFCEIDEKRQQFVDDVLGFKSWVAAIRELGCEGHVNR